MINRRAPWHRSGTSLSLRAVRAFVALDRCGSVTRAAADLGVSAGAVSQLIHTLEQHLDLRLIERSGRGVVLTSWGRMYLPYALEAMDQLHRGERELQRARCSGRLVVSAFPSVVNRWLGPLSFAWRELHPDVSIFLHASETEPRLEDNEVDFRISYGARGRLYQRYQQLFTDFLLPVASPSLLAQRGSITSPRGVLQFPLLWVDWGPEYDLVPTWREYLGEFGVLPEEVPCDFTYSLSSAALDAATEGRGLVLAQYSMVEAALRCGNLVRLFDYSVPLPESYFLAWGGTTLDKAHGNAFKAWLSEEAKRFDWRLRGSKYRVSSTGILKPARDRR